MKPIYIIFFLFFAGLAGITAYQFKRKAFGVLTFAYLILIFTLLSLLSLEPEVVTQFLELIGLKYTASFLTVVLVFLFSGYLFYQIGMNARMNREAITAMQYLSVLHSRADSAAARPAKDILVKMAAYNEAESIGAVLGAMPDYVDVLVIDDASHDDTAAVARRHGARVIRHLKNMGQGVADITGFLWAVDKDYKYVIEMDADGQHDPADIPNFVAALEQDPDVDIVVGSRILGQQSGSVDFLRKVFLPWYTRMINKASGYRLTDALCGYKAFRFSALREDIQQYLPLLETQYIAAELYIKFGRSKLRISEIPVHVKPRSHGKSRKGSLRYGVAVAWIIVRTLLSRTSVR